MTTTEPTAESIAESIARPRLIPLEEFFSDPEFSGASLSPDGTRIAYLAPRAAGATSGSAGSTRSTPTPCASPTTPVAASAGTTGPTTRAGCCTSRTPTATRTGTSTASTSMPRTSPPSTSPVAAGVRVVGVDPLEGVPGSILVMMNRRPLYFDYFRVDVATGETTLHLEQAAPTETILLDRAGAPVFGSRLADDEWRVFAIDPDGQRRPIHTAGGAEHPVGVLPSTSHRTAGVCSWGPTATVTTCS